MSDFISDLLGKLSGGTTEKIGSSLGVDQSVINQIIPVLAPMILGGLKNQSANNGGQDRVDHILNKYGDPGVLDNVDGLLQNKLNQDNADPDLGGLLGNSGSSVTNMLSEKFGINASTAAKIIPIVAPLILGYLTKSRDNNPQGSSGFASFLDKNGDGSILDDVVGMISGTQQGGQQNQSNPLMDILGGLLGGKK